jgi:hypothetical protein
VPPLAGAQLAPCASSARAWWLCECRSAGSLPKGQAGPPTAQPPTAQPAPRLLERAASIVADSPSFWPSLLDQVQHHLHATADRAQLDQGVPPCHSLTPPLPPSQPPITPSHDHSHPLATPSPPPHTRPLTAPSPPPHRPLTAPLPPLTQAIFVSLVNPVAFEIIVVWCRVLARSHRHNHPLTSVMTVAVAMTLKKLYGRYAYPHPYPNLTPNPNPSLALTLTLTRPLPSPAPLDTSPDPNPHPDPNPNPDPDPDPSHHDQVRGGDDHADELRDNVLGLPRPHGVRLA